MMYTYAQPSPFPPSFDGNPWAYGFGLFGDVVAAALGLALLLAHAMEGRNNRKISAILRNPVKEPALPWNSVNTIYRLKNSSIWLFIVMRALPDAIWMLCWGEVSDRTIRALLAVDLWCDGLAVVPMVVAIACWAWGRQVMEQIMLRDQLSTVNGAIPWRAIARSGRIILLVMLLAVGVTIGKASTKSHWYQNTVNRQAA